ncbi:hypothetical protein [uncultured Helicobacter sp.]|uniref:tetratricopeptide repeat protein n=1 Tax=uncultured Helicobacter sp. TaxID=175537 RepID=UPI002635487B|nr:hypothetical protein [uncultured Helicobacter sp.]
MWLKNKILLSLSFAFLLILGLVGCLRNDFKFSFANANFAENQEDIFIMQGYAALDTQDLQGAKDAFSKAYAIKADKNYLKEILGILVAQQDFENAKKQAYEYLAKYPKDEEVRGALVGILTSTKDFDNALKEAKKLISYHKTAQTYEILASVYFLREDFQNAAQTLSKAYALTRDELLLDRLGAIYLLFLKQPQKTIALYETHLRMYGVSSLIGEKLAIIYTESKNYAQAAQVYVKLYETLGNQSYAKLALEFYFKLKRLDLAKAFLLKNPKIDARDEILLEVYRLQKDYANSIKQAKSLYQNTQDLNYLAYYAMMRYENMQSFSRTKLAEIEKDLKTSASKLEDALYWNYLGYLMIEHDFKDSVRIQEGMKYVQLALDKEPQNVYYLDSLAWGYYKLKDCKKAKEIIDKIPQNEREKETEINEHYKTISRCLRQ